MQPNQRGDYHDHDEMEQLYYFTEGAGQMQIDGEVRHGDGCASLLWAVGCVSLSKLFVSGRARSCAQVIDVREGDSVYIPPKVKHQMINSTDEWVEHLLLSCPDLSRA